jgi:hypothetical protein
MYISNACAAVNLIAFLRMAWKVRREECIYLCFSIIAYAILSSLSSNRIFRQRAVLASVRKSFNGLSVEERDLNLYTSSGVGLYILFAYQVVFILVLFMQGEFFVMMNIFMHVPFIIVSTLSGSREVRSWSIRINVALQSVAILMIVNFSDSGARRAVISRTLLSCILQESLVENLLDFLPLTIAFGLRLGFDTYAGKHTVRHEEKDKLIYSQKKVKTPFLTFCLLVLPLEFFGVRAFAAKLIQPQSSDSRKLLAPSRQVALLALMVPLCSMLMSFSMVSHSLKQEPSVVSYQILALLHVLVSVACFRYGDELDHFVSQVNYENKRHYSDRRIVNAVW